jgi:hypothetical protein
LPFAFVVAAGAGLPADDRPRREVVALRHHDRIQILAGDQLANARVILAGDRLVGIERQDPVAGGLFEREVPREAEVVLPLDVKQAGAECARDLHRPIGAAGIDEDDFVRELTHRLEAAGEVGFLVFRDQADAERGHSERVTMQDRRQPCGQPGQVRPHGKVLAILPFQRYPCRD